MRDKDKENATVRAHARRSVQISPRGRVKSNGYGFLGVKSALTRTETKGSSINVKVVTRYRMEAISGRVK